MKIYRFYLIFIFNTEWLLIDLNLRFFVWYSDCVLLISMQLNFTYTLYIIIMFFLNIGETEMEFLV